MWEAQQDVIENKTTSLIKRCTTRHQMQLTVNYTETGTGKINCLFNNSSKFERGKTWSHYLQQNVYIYHPYVFFKLFLYYSFFQTKPLSLINPSEILTWLSNTKSINLNTLSSITTPLAIRASKVFSRPCFQAAARVLTWSRSNPLVFQTIL
jgi:hypothetical protein